MNIINKFFRSNLTKTAVICGIILSTLTQSNANNLWNTRMNPYGSIDPNRENTSFQEYAKKAEAFGNTGLRSKKTLLQKCEDALRDIRNQAKADAHNFKTLKKRGDLVELSKYTAQYTCRKIKLLKGPAGLLALGALGTLAALANKDPKNTNGRI